MSRPFNANVLANHGIDAADTPTVASSVREEELSVIATSNLVRHLAAWNYFMSVDTPENQAFIDKWHAFINDDDRVNN